MGAFLRHFRNAFVQQGQLSFSGGNFKICEVGIFNGKEGRLGNGGREATSCFFYRKEDVSTSVRCGMEFMRTAEETQPDPKIPRLNKKLEAADSFVNVPIRSSETLIRGIRHYWRPMFTAGVTASIIIFMAAFVLLYSKARATEIRVESQAIRVRQLHTLVLDLSVQEDLPARIQKISDSIRDMEDSLEGIRRSLGTCPGPRSPKSDP